MRNVFFPLWLNNVVVLNRMGILKFATVKDAGIEKEC